MSVLVPETPIIGRNLVAAELRPPRGPASLRSSYGPTHRSIKKGTQLG
jgi:hypothetical protein